MSQSNMFCFHHRPILMSWFQFLFRVTLFGDELNAVNLSGICVVFLGVFLYKATLLINQMDVETPSADIENDAEFSRVRMEDAYDNEGISSERRSKRLHGHKNSDPDLALRFRIDDDDEEEEEDEVVVNGSGKSALSLRGRGNGSSLELDKRRSSDSDNIPAIT